MLTIIGLDPPVSANCGWTVISLDDAGKLQLHEKFTQVLTYEKGDDRGLEDVYQKLTELIQKYHPNVLSMERQMGVGFAFGRAKLNEFVGVVKLCCLRNNVKVAEVSPAHVKLLITGHGQAPKTKIMANVVEVFGLKEPGPEHECDAVAFVLSYLIDNGWTGYTIRVEYTKAEQKAIKAKKLKRKKKKLAREKAKLEALAKTKEETSKGFD